MQLAGGANVGMLATAKNIIRTEGYFAPFYGISGNVMRQTFLIGSRLGFYNMLKRRFEDDQGRLSFWGKVDLLPLPASCVLLGDNRRRLGGTRRRLGRNRWRLEANRRRLGGNRRRLDGNRRPLGGNRWWLEGSCVHSMFILSV